jgi:hypothetical protein
MDNLKRVEIEKMFKDRCIAQRIRYESKRYYESQADFFAGVMTALNELLPYWTICCTSDRPIIEPYKL